MSYRHSLKMRYCASAAQVKFSRIQIQSRNKRVFHVISPKSSQCAAQVFAFNRSLVVKEKKKSGKFFRVCLSLKLLIWICLDHMAKCLQEFQPSVFLKIQTTGHALCFYLGSCLHLCVWFGLVQHHIKKKKKKKTKRKRRNPNHFVLLTALPEGKGCKFWNLSVLQ